MRNYLPLLSALLVTACLGGSQPENAIYAIRPQTSDAAAAKSACNSGINLQVAQPTTTAGLSSRRIAILQGEDRINYYTGARWAAPVTDMMQSLLVSTLDQSHAFHSVTPDTQPVTANLTLLTEIRDFEVTNISTPTIRVQIASKLVNAKGEKVLATVVFDKSTDVDVNKTENIVATFNDLAAEAANGILQKTARFGCKGAN